MTESTEFFLGGGTIPWTLIKQQNTEKNHSLFLTENFNTVALGISQYSFNLEMCLFSFLNAHAEYTYCTWK